jgi:hypothetical protein
MKLNGIFSIIPAYRGLPALSSWLGVGRVVTTVYMMAAMDPLISIPHQATSGCGAPSPWAFDSTHHSNQTIGDRAFYVHIPASYNPNVPHAVVLSFHGFKGNDLQQEEISGFSQSGLKINGQVRAFDGFLNISP